MVNNFRHAAFQTFGLADYARGELEQFKVQRERERISNLRTELWLLFGLIECEARSLEFYVAACRSGRTVREITGPGRVTLFEAKHAWRAREIVLELTERKRGWRLR